MSVPDCVAAGAHKSVTAAAPRPCLSVKAKTVVSPETTALATAASNWRLQIMAHQLARWEPPASLFCVSGSSRTTNSVQSRCGTDESTRQTDKKDRCWSGRGLESPLSDSVLPCQPQLDGDRDRDRDRDELIKWSTRQRMRMITGLANS